MSWDIALIWLSIDDDYNMKWILIKSLDYGQLFTVWRRLVRNESATVASS